uniref:DDE-1 domain-containing protein n=1 Tax=Amphimedon queenslandica TaxID=400682 RepID=A0A1X7VXQ7_AMPQE
MKWHPSLANRRPQHLQLVRAKALNEEVVRHWFHKCLSPVLTNLDVTGKPDNIYNVDESGFPLSWTPKCILSRRGQKSPQALLAGSGWENITVQLCTSATGKLLPPYVVYKGERLMSDTTYGGPLGTRYSVTQNGWMTELTFLDWMKSLFIPFIGDKKPILLILDGHLSHVSYEVRLLALEHAFNHFVYYVTISKFNP